ncbi:MAG: hypothetical protein V3R81_15260 [Gammaproteobacteria bacterium]
MKKTLAALLLVGMLVSAGTVYAQEESANITFTKIPDKAVDLFSKLNNRQSYDNQRAEASLELSATCDASGRYTVHYWRNAEETGAIYLDGCVHGDVSVQVAEILGTLDMDAVPEHLLVTGRRPYHTDKSYTINLFCTGKGKRVIIDDNFARCTTE